MRSRFGVALPTERTAVFGVSAGGELALAIGLRHPDVYGAVFSASPGAGYRPPGVMPSSIPRTYLVAGTLEPFFLENATRWADALRDAGADVVMTERVGSHGDAFWYERVPADGGVGVWTMKHHGVRSAVGHSYPNPTRYRSRSVRRGGRTVRVVRRTELCDLAGVTSCGSGNTT